MTAQEIRNKLNKNKPKSQEPANTPVAAQPSKALKSTTFSTPAKSGGMTAADIKNRLDNSKAQQETPNKFYLGLNKYVKTTDGEYKRASTDISKPLSDADRESYIKTGHETFGTDISEAMSGGGKHWLASQLSTAATIPLAISAAAHKDNFYEPENNSTLWKMLKASSANTREANELMQDSKAGRNKWGGGLVMDAASQFVENGIDRAMMLIPVVGGALHTASFASRSFGAQAQQARDEGKSIGAQVISGAVASTVETITESIWSYGGGLGRGIGGRMGDNSGLLGRLTLSAEAALAKKCGPIVSKLAMAFGTEAIEEMLADVLNPALGSAVENMTKGGKLAPDYEAEEWHSFEDIAYSGLVGGIAGIGGGIATSIGAQAEFKSDFDSNKALYAAAIRNEAQQQTYASRAASSIRNASILDSLEALFSRKTGKTFSERVSDTIGIFTSKGKAFQMLANMDEDLQKMLHNVAKDFADNNFANEVVSKDVLEKAVYNFLVSGNFGEELNSIEGARDQIQALSKNIMEEFAQKKLDEAKSKKDKASAAFYSSMLSKYANQYLHTEESTNANVDDITEARTYGYTAEELAADQAAREAELHPEQERPAYVARQEQAQQAQQQEGWVMRGDTNIYDPRNQAYIQKNNPELWAEYQKAKSISGDAGVSAMRDATAKMQAYLADVNRESNVSWQTVFSPTTESGIIEENAMGEMGETYGKQTVQNNEEVSRIGNHREWFDSKNRINAEQGQKIDAFVSGGAEEAVSGSLRVRTRDVARGKAKDVIFNKATVDNATEIISALQSSDGFNGHTFYNSESKEYTGHILSSEELTDEEKSLVKLATLATNSMIFVYDGELSNNDVAFTRYTAYGSPIIVARMTDLAHEGVHSVIKELMWAETSRVYDQLSNKAKDSIYNADFKSIMDAALDFVQERYADELKRIAIYSYNSQALYDTTMDYIKEVYGFSGDDSKTIYRSNEELIAHLFNEEDYAFATPGEVNRLINVFIKSKNETIENFALNIIPLLEKYSGYSFSEEEIDSDEAFGISNISDAEIDRLLLGDTLANTQRSRIKQLYEKVGLVYDERSKKEERHKLNNERKFESKIDSFRDDNFFLSNMYRTPVTIDGITYPSAENAFQALKCANKEDRQKFVNISPFEAKKLGKTVKAVENWEYKRIEAMRNVLRAKFSNQRLYNMLKKTSGSELVEGNDWGDNFWGVSEKNNKKLKGQNYLGKLLMDIRDGTKTVRSITELTKRAISGDLSDITDDQLQYVFNYTLKRAGIKRSSSEILNDITDFVLGNFEKDFVGRDNFRTGQYKEGFSGVDAGYSFGNTESSRSYLRMPLDNGNISRRSLEVTTDAYTRDEEPSGFSVSNQALALLHLVDEIDHRPKPVINHWVDSYNNQSESSVVETPIDIKDEDFERGGKFSGLDKDYVKSVAESLRDGYDEGFLTEQATDLRSSLMSGFAPSAEYSIGDLTVDQRLNLLKLAYPGQDYSVSSFNPNEIVEGRKSTELKEYERGEREWNKRHLQNGAEADDNKTAFGYLRADPTPIQIGTDKKGNPIMGSGWVDTGKANQENVSVEDKRSALEKIAKGKEAEGKIKSIKKRLADIDRARNGLKAVLEARKNRLVDYTSEQLDAANKAQEYLYDMLEDADDLGRYGWASSSEDGQARLAKVNYEKGVLKLTLQSIQNTDPGMLYDDDLNRYIVSHLESLAEDAKSLYQEIDRQQKLVREASYRGTQRNAIKNNWIDVMSSKELRDLFRDENGSSYYDNLMLTSYEKEYINERLERENTKDNRPLGSDDLPVQTKKTNDMSPEDIKLAKQYNLRNKTESLHKSGDNIPTLNEFRTERGETSRQDQYGMEENEDAAATGSQRIQMDDAEYNELRQADKAIPTQQDFIRSQNEQPTAEKKMSPAAANEIAERSFGKKGRVRATRVVESFPTNFKMSAKALTDAQAEVLNNNLGKMRKALIDINDGYGTVKDAADIYKSWRDNKLLADYYDEDIAARFDKILEDAEAKGWTFEAQDQREFAQAYEEACNAMTAKINNVNKSADRLSRLKTEAIANKLNIKSDGLVSKAIQRFIRMQITTDTAMKLFGGFKGSGEFYQLGKDIKDGVAKRMVKYVDAYSHFDNLKKMEGFKEFSQNTKKYQLKFNNEFNDKGVGLDNPLKGVDLSLQQIVTISRLIKTLDKTFEHSDAKAADRVKGFVIRDSNGNSKTIDLGLGDTTDTTEAVKASGKMTAIKLACDRILNQDGAVFEVARAYDKACDAMFKSMGKDVSAVKKALTGNALSLIGEDYTPVLWANDDGSPAEFNFNDDDRLRPPAFLYNRTAKQGNLVVSDISYIVDKYIEKAADYIGTAEIKDTLSRLNDGTSLLDKGKGLNSSLAENFGKDAGTWFDEYVKDLTQYGENDSIWAALRRNMQKGALIGSPSVMMKQTSSYWSAMGLLSPEALAMAYRWKVGVKAADNSEYNRLLKYRHISDNIDPTLTEIIKGVDKYGKASNSRVFQLFTNGISEQDFKTVDNLYTATMIDTYLKNQNKGAEYFTSGGFQNDIDSKFTEVMMRSQPMFDTELRAEYARTDNELVKMTSMFRTQQTQNLNLIATAIGEYNASKGTGEQGEKLKVLQQTVAGQASAALSLALLSVAADFMLHGLKKYRGDGDDDDEEPGDGKIELGRILGRIGLNTVETGAGTVWFGDSVAKWLIDRMSGGETNEFYGLNMGPITTFKNVLDNLEYVAKSPTPSNIKNVATNISQLMGIPLNNAYRIVNSAVMYVEDVVGTNDKNYDDMLKQVTNRTKVNEKNVAGRNLLVESGMTKREATAFVKTVDVDDNGLNKEDLQNYYIEHPEDAERVSILWDSMGWKTKFEKEQKSLDKKVVYNSNPLYAEMDEDESGSVTKTEMMDYALEHEDQIDELSALYKEQGFKGSFRSALKSAENSKLKEQAEDAFYEGDYNVLFDTVSQMKNGKTYLTNLIKDEYDEYDNVSNPLVRYMIDAKRPVKEIDEAVEAYGAKKFIPQYKALRATGLAPKAAIQKLDNFDANANGSITQQELADYYKAHKDEEAMIAEFWKACGWSTTWSKYKKRKKLK